MLVFSDMLVDTIEASIIVGFCGHKLSRGVRAGQQSRQLSPQILWQVASEKSAPAPMGYSGSWGVMGIYLGMDLTWRSLTCGRNLLTVVDAVEPRCTSLGA